MRTQTLALISFVALGCSQSEPKQATPPTPPTPDPKVVTPPPPPLPPPPPPSAPQVVKLEGFKTPESILWDKQANVYLVSNINGDAFGKDDNGFISRVSGPPDAKVTEPNELRGSAIVDGESRRIGRGDVVVVPAGVPHMFTEVSAPLNYYVVKVR